MKWKKRCSFLFRNQLAQIQYTFAKKPQQARYMYVVPFVLLGENLRDERRFSRLLQTLASGSWLFHVPSLCQYLSPFDQNVV